MCITIKIIYVYIYIFLKFKFRNLRILIVSSIFQLLESVIIFNLHHTLSRQTWTFSFSINFDSTSFFCSKMSVRFLFCELILAFWRAMWASWTSSKSRFPWRRIRHCVADDLLPRFEELRSNSLPPLSHSSSWFLNHALVPGVIRTPYWAISSGWLTDCWMPWTPHLSVQMLMDQSEEEPHVQKTFLSGLFGILTPFDWCWTRQICWIVSPGICGPALFCWM